MLIVCYRPHTLFDRYAVRALRCPIDKEKPDGFFGGRAGATSLRLGHARATFLRLGRAGRRENAFLHTNGIFLAKNLHIQKKSIIFVAILTNQMLN